MCIIAVDGPQFGGCGCSGSACVLVSPGVFRLMLVAVQHLAGTTVLWTVGHSCSYVHAVALQLSHLRRSGRFLASPRG